MAPLKLTNKSRTIRRTITSGLKSTVRGLQKDAIEMNNGEVNLESTSRRKHPEMVGLDEIWWFSVDLEGSQSNEQGIPYNNSCNQGRCVCSLCKLRPMFDISTFHQGVFFIESTKKNMNPWISLFLKQTWIMNQARVWKLQVIMNSGHYHQCTYTLVFLHILHWDLIDQPCSSWGSGIITKCHPWRPGLPEKRFGWTRELNHFQISVSNPQQWLNNGIHLESSLRTSTDI